MDSFKLLAVLIISAAAVAGFQLSSSLGKFKILPLGELLERFTNPLNKKIESKAFSFITQCTAEPALNQPFRRDI
jgi:hypothetical protein